MLRKKNSFVRFIYKLIFLFIFFGIIGISCLAFWISGLKIPDFESFENRKIIQSTKIYDRTGKILLWDIHKDINRTTVSLEKISRHLKNATVAIEDSGFYQHRGIDFLAVARALLKDIASGAKKQGASTISQQLIKNSLLSREKSFVRKTKEIILTLKLEKFFSKEKILELYLNEIPYGGSNYGIEAASQNFFGKTAEQLTLAESAYLASLPKAPTYYSPYGDHLKELEERKNLVLKKMRELGFITQKEEEKAAEEKVIFISKGDNSIKAPHFSIFIRSYLEQKYGKDIVEQEGLKVITTLDYNIQQKAEELVKKYAEENTKKFNAYNAGLVAIDPKTGQILAMVGSRDWYENPLPVGCKPGVDCKFEPKPNVTSYGQGRQPGSSIKPFIYAAAFKKGYTPDTIVFDLDTEFNSSCNPDHTPKPGTNINPEKCYSPKNYDNIFRGPVTFRNSLAQSINVPSVKVLYLAGLKDSLKTIQDMGINTLNDPNRYGLTLVLGGGEVSLLELTAGYAVFANNGIKNPTAFILKIEGPKGNTLEEFNPLINGQKDVLDKNICLLISDILSDNTARTPAFGANSYFYFPDRQVAVKSGTTNDYRDAWVVGYTPNFSAGVWIGNNDNSSMEKKVAGFIAAPLWNEFFGEVLKNLPKEEFVFPEQTNSTAVVKPFLRGEWQGGLTYKIDKISKKLATEFTPSELIEEKVLIQIHSILNWINKNDPLGHIPENPGNDPQFELWETPVREWAAKQNIKEQTQNDIPKEIDDVHKPEYAPGINIITPTENAIYNPNNTMNIEFSYQGKFEIEQADFYLNNTYLGSLKKAPLKFSFAPSNTKELRLSAEIRIIVYDKVRNKKEFVVPINFAP